MLTSLSKMFKKTCISNKTNKHCEILMTYGNVSVHYINTNKHCTVHETFYLKKKDKFWGVENEPKKQMYDISNKNKKHNDC